MKALRLIIHQTSANYKREETVDNKMTYPLPPFSTVMGALHSACGYRETKDMDISIQGRYASMHREPYTDFCFLNSTQDDRGILVKMKNADMLSCAFEKVASAKKSQGNSFRNGITIQTHNQRLLDEYRSLKNLNDEIIEFKKKRFNPTMNLLKGRKKALAAKKKMHRKDCSQYSRIEKREKELQQIEKEMKERMQLFQKEQYEVPISKFRTLVKSIKFYEVLDDIELIIHVRAKEEVLNELFEHRYDIKSIGRSEDFVSVEDAEIVDLVEEFDEEVESEYSAYLDFLLFRKEEQQVFINKKYGSGGTRYYLNKKYKVIDGKRSFEKKEVLYVSGYTVETFGHGLYLDINGEKKYIVNFL